MANGRGWLLPTVLAVLLTVLNAAKPAVVDDTAYLLTARHIAAHPADPYGFDLFWYDRPLPAWQVLLPPVVPYWLGLGIGLFGEHLVVLKLWVYPFALALAHSLAFLLRRFARGYDRPMLVMLVLGPAVLPLFNVMLDLPAVALGLSAVAVFIRGCERERWSATVLSGVLVGLAMQTKYTMLTVPAVIALYGLTHRNKWKVAAALAIAAGVFCGWEAFIAQKYGQSHFLFHLQDQGNLVTKDAADDPSPAAKIKTVLQEKARLFQPMLGYLGWLGVGVWLTAAFALGVPRRVIAGCAVLAALGVIAVCVTPAKWSVLVPRKLELPTAVFVTVGSAAGLTVLANAWLLLFRIRWPRLVRRDRTSLFLVGWLALELAGFFALTPFAAARRVIGLTVVGGLIAARTASRTSRVRASRRPPVWVPAYGVVAGFALYGIDLWDALPEKVLAEWAAAACEPGSRTVWFNGHWGFQYSCDVSGMHPVVPGHSKLKEGDYLVFPAIPDDTGFYRPYHGEAKFDIDPKFVESVKEFVWEDRLPAQTIPDLYGGEVPVSARKHPRLQVVVYRVRADWVPPKAP